MAWKYRFRRTSYQFNKKNYLRKRTQCYRKKNQSVWVTLKRGVQKGTIFCHLLFDIYVKDSAKLVENDCNPVQYADKKFFSTSKINGIWRFVKTFEHSISKPLNFFYKISQFILNKLNKQQTEYIVFSTKKNEKHRLKLNEKTKNLLHRMACGQKFWAH